MWPSLDVCKISEVQIGYVILRHNYVKGKQQHVGTVRQVRKLLKKEQMRSASREHTSLS